MHPRRVAALVPVLRLAAPAAAAVTAILGEPVVGGCGLGSKRSGGVDSLTVHFQHLRVDTPFAVPQVYWRAIEASAVPGAREAVRGLIARLKPLLNLRRPFLDGILGLHFAEGQIDQFKAYVDVSAIDEERAGGEPGGTRALATDPARRDQVVAATLEAFGLDGRERVLADLDRAETFGLTLDLIGLNIGPGPLRELKFYARAATGVPLPVALPLLQGLGAEDPRLVALERLGFLLTYAAPGADTAGVQATRFVARHAVGTPARTTAAALLDGLPDGPERLEQLDPVLAVCERLEARVAYVALSIEAGRLLCKFYFDLADEVGEAVALTTNAAPFQPWTRRAALAYMLPRPARRDG